MFKVLPRGLTKIIRGGGMIMCTPGGISKMVHQKTLPFCLAKKCYPPFRLAKKMLPLLLKYDRSEQEIVHIECFFRVF
jgi:hypothetical protein